MEKAVYLTVKVIVNGDADVSDIVENVNYEFSHPDIMSTEIVDCSTED